MMRLRLLEGVSFQEVALRFGADQASVFRERCMHLTAQGFLAIQNDVVALSASGVLVLDDIIVQLLA